MFSGRTGEQVASGTQTSSVIIESISCCGVSIESIVLLYEIAMATPILSLEEALGPFHAENVSADPRKLFFYAFVPTIEVIDSGNLRLTLSGESCE